jgi:4-diphosphocytidyl-2-C-methyl-D-erythritol kinase
MTALRLDAPAKLNLSLAVVGRRADGFHVLDSVLVLIELSDRLLLLPGSQGLRVDADEGLDDVPRQPERNLAWRGLLAGLAGSPAMAFLTLDKRIPSGAGLGGGSSDAAAGWRLGRSWSGVDTDPAAAECAALSVIGADVPFFAAMLPAARVRGIGEQVEPAVLPEARHAVLLVAPFRLSTAAVYAELRPGDWSTDPVETTAAGRNDLLEPARRLRPELDDLRGAVRRAGGEPRLTGSGPTLFCLVDDPSRADAVVTTLAATGLRVIRTRLASQAARIERLVEEQEGVSG